MDSPDTVPEEALEQELLNHRDNLKIALDHSNKNKKGANWAAVERQLRNVEKRVEHYTNLALQHWGAKMGIQHIIERKEKIKERPIVLRRRRERVKAEANWLLFYYKFNQDHALHNLIWNHKVSIRP